MGVFRNWPYTNFHDLNLDWITAKFKHWQDTFDNLNQVITDIVNNALDEMNLPQMIDDAVEAALNERQLVVNIKYPPTGVTPAKGDGADDTATFQGCIDYLAGNGGGLLFVPDGRWMSHELTIKNGVYVMGASPTTTITLIGGSDTPLFSGSVTDCGWYNISLNGNGSFQAAPENVIQVQGNIVLIDNVNLSGGDYGANISVDEHAFVSNVNITMMASGGLAMEGNGYVICRNVDISNISSVTGVAAISNNADNAVYDTVDINSNIPTGVYNTGDYMRFSGAVVGCNTAFDNTGDYLEIEAHVTGATTVIEDAGTGTSYRFTGQSSQRKIGDDLLNIGTSSPVMYKTPTPLNNSFSAIPFQTYNGITYNVLVEGEYLQSGTFISAADYGAVGDGVTDDTNALQNWLNYIAENGKMGFLPDGTYLISQLTFRSPGKHFTILGESMNNTVLKVSGVLNALDLRTVTGANIGNFTIDMNQSNNSTSGTALYGVDVNDITYHDIIIKNVNYAATLFYHSENTKYLNNINFNNVQIYGAGTNTDGIHPTGFLLANAYNSHIDKCYVKDVYYYAYEYKNYSKYCFVTDSFAENCFQGFYLGGDAQPTPTFYTENITVSNFTAYNCYQPIWCGMSKNNILTGINIYIDSEYSLSANSYGLNIRNCENIIVSAGLLMWQGTPVAIDVRNSTAVQVSAVNAVRVSGTGRLTNLIECTNCNITTEYTNDTSTRPLSTDSNYFAITNSVYSFGAQRKRVALTPISEFLTNMGNVNMEAAEQLWLQFYSQNNSAERFSFGSATQQIITDYDHVNNRIVLTFENGTCYIDKDGVHTGAPT